jgi:hypothetical protein
MHAKRVTFPLTLQAKDRHGRAQPLRVALSTIPTPGYLAVIGSTLAATEAYGSPRRSGVSHRIHPVNFVRGHGSAIHDVSGSGSFSA